MRGAVHDVLVKRPEEVVVDSRGKWTTEDRHIRVRGVFSRPSLRELALATRSGVVVDMVVHLPVGTEVTRDSVVVAENIDLDRDGSYAITSIRPNRRFIRCTLERRKEKRED